MGSTKEIKIVNFIMPHIFYISEKNDNYRTNFLDTMSNMIKKSQPVLIQENQANGVSDEIVAVYYESTLVRATVLDTERNEDLSKSYHCWLIDCGLVIETKKIYKLRQDIQKITPICKQASLDHFCYLDCHLELGVLGSVVSKPTVVPPRNVTRMVLDLLANHEKIVFEEKGQHGDIVTGEVIIHKNGEVLYLEQELIKKGIITKNENKLFSSLLAGSQKYLKTHLTLLYQCSSVNKRTVKASALASANVKDVLLENEMEDLDITESFRTENGRRYRLSKQKSPSVTSDSDTNTPNSKSNAMKPSCNNNDETRQTALDIPRPLTRSQIIAQKLKEIKAALANKNAANRYEEGNSSSYDSISVCSSHSETNNSLEEQPEVSNTGDTSSCDSISVCSSESGKNNSLERSSRVDDTTEVGTQFSKEKRSSLVNRSTESGNGCIGEQSCSLINSTIDSDCNVSTFSSITSQKLNRPKLPLFAAERSFTQLKKDSCKGITTRKVGTSTTKKIPKDRTTKDGDCPTIKIPKAPDSLTDDDAEGKPEETEETSSSDSVKPEIFTKQDFCKLVGGCNCSACRAAFEEDNWDTPIKFDFSEEEVKKSSESKELIIKPPTLLKPESATRGQDVSQNEVLSINYAGMTSMEKKRSSKVLVHSESIPVPIRQVSKVNIHKDIYNSVSRLNYQQSKRIQHYAFPAITRNQHVIMVNDAKSGKTMAYLPILLSFIMEQKERYSKLLKIGGGPFAVILCSTSKRCEEIHDLMKVILHKNNTKCTLATYPGYGNMSKVEILITMPAVLSHLIFIKATDFKRLCHFVLEDADLILKSHNDMIKKFLNLADQVLRHRNCPKSIQLIMCAQHWTVQMEDILLKMNQVPTVCIGNYLEAALYGKIKFSMKFLDSKYKESSLQQVLHDKYKFTKSVVICNQDEVEGIQTFFTLKGIEYMSFRQIDDEEDILYVENAWNNVPAGNYLVLVCTDDIYNTINITSAQLLIHYSLPHSWTQFIKRFSCLLENVQSPLNNNQSKHELSTYIFVDEHCEPRMSKFSNLVKISGIEKDLPEQIKTFFVGVSQQEQQARVSQKIELCNVLKIFGKCDSLFCKKRHILHKELDDNSDILHKNGTIRFKIITMTSAGSCSIKLLEHFDLNDQSVCKYEDCTDEISDIIANMQYYHPVSKWHISHIYLTKDENKYFRCRLLEVDDHALVFLIDKGVYSYTDINRLFKMPEELKKIPPQAYEIHFANLIPPYDDKTFSRHARQKAQFLIDSNCPNSTMTATIMLQLGNNFWVDDVYEYVEMHDQSFPSIGFQLTRELVNGGLAIKDTKQLQRFYDLCVDAKIKLPEYKLAKPSVKKVVSAQVQPNWAFLDLNEVQDVIFTSAVNPNEFYVRHNKFTCQLQQLEESIQKEICKPLYPKPQKIEIGKCYLVKDKVSGEYNRGLILSLEEQEAEVFCVDYGDIVYVDLSTLKHISNEHILKLPFQSILCSLWGIKPIYDEWSVQATDSLYTIAYEPDQTTLRKLALKVNSKQESPFIQKQKSYKVTLATVKDGLPKLVNDLLINCGFAIPNDEEEIKIFELPEKVDDDDDDDDSDDDENIEQIIREDDDIKQLIEREKIDYEAFDFEVIDFDSFLDTIDFSIKPNENKNLKAIEDKNASDTNLPPMKTAPAVDYLTPEVCWSETDTHVKLVIKLYDVVEANFAVKLNRHFHFSTNKNGQKYSLNLLLYAKVERTVQHTILGSQIRVLLKKQNATSWPRLLYTKGKVRKICYDISAMNLNDDEEKKRVPLQLDLSDSSSEEDDKVIDTPYFDVGSDMDDSDYDFDIPGDDNWER